MRVVRVVLLAVAALLLSACQVRIGTDVDVRPDGSGTVVLRVVLDEELHTSLTADGFEPYASVEELPEGWAATTVEGGRGIELSTSFSDPAELEARVADLQEGLDDEDPVMLDAVQLDVDADGSATFRARAGLRPPSSTGIAGPGISFDGEALEAALQERGDELVRHDLRLVLPGPVVDGNADEVDGRMAVWRLPVTDLREIHAVGDPATPRIPWLLVAAVAVGAALVGFVGALLFRRRRA